MDVVIFACVHNAGRSQMAAAFFNTIADGTVARATSAGTAPAERVHPEVAEVMREVGIDLSGARPQKLTDELARGAKLLVTMGCGDQCPYVPGLKVLDWPLPDPKGQSVESVRATRDDIRRRVEGLVRAQGWSATAGAAPLAADAEFFSALLAADVKALDCLLADDFVIIDVMRGGEIPKAGLLEGLASGEVKFEKVEAAEPRARVYGSTVVVTGRTRMQMRLGETAVDVSSRYAHVYVERAGAWRLVSAQSTPIAPESEPPRA